MAKKLTGKRRAFTIEYAKDFNGTQAAIRAGYAVKGARVTASRLLTNANIRAAIEEEYKKRGKSLDEIIARLSSQAEASIGDFVIINPDGDRIVFDPDAIKNMGHLIKRIKANTTVRYTEKGDQLEYTSLDLTLYDGQKALDILGKHSGMLTEKVEHVGEIVLKVVRDGDSDTSDN
jgi:phage terminase small subunit